MLIFRHDNYKSNQIYVIIYHYQYKFTLHWRQSRISRAAPGPRSLLCPAASTGSTPRSRWRSWTGGCCSICNNHNHRPVQIMQRFRNFRIFVEISGFPSSIKRSNITHLLCGKNVPPLRSGCSSLRYRVAPTLSRYIYIPCRRR